MKTSAAPTNTISLPASRSACPVGAAALAGPGSVFSAADDELAVVGGVIESGAPALEQASAVGLTPDDIADGTLQAVYKGVVAAIEVAEPVGMAWITRALQSGLDGSLAERLTARGAMVHAVAYHAKRIIHAADLRRVRDALDKARKQLAEPGANAALVASETASRLESRQERGERLQIVDATAYVATDPPPHNPIVEGLFEAGDKIGIVASAKRKKSWFALQLAIAVAAGRPFLGWRVPTPRRVLIVQPEIKPDHYHRRVHYMMQSLGLSGDDIGDRLGIVNGRGLGLTPADLRRLARKHGADLLVVDPLYKLATGDENKAADIKPLLAVFDEVAVATGAAVCWVHHDSKGSPGDRDARDRGAGSNVLIRDVDQLFTMTPHRDDPEATVVETLARNYTDEGPTTIVWQDGCFVTSDLPAVAKTSRTESKYADALRQLDASEPGLSLADAAARLGCDRSTISRLRRFRGGVA